MSAPITDPAATPSPEGTEPPADQAPQTTEAPGTPPAAEPEPSRSLDDASPEVLRAEVVKLRKESAGWRTKYQDAKPLAEAQRAAQEADKTDLQRQTERAEALERELADLRAQNELAAVAAEYGIEPDDYDFLGSGTREELEARAKRLAARSASARPPTDRPVESLKPGASPESPAPADDSYPAAWRPNHLPNQ